ncbi:hypothetical protein FRB91_011832 [Serendipita sp. 411]|nr:hypothetical protein FRB91_011832 [Serendipita sp. 411]
MKLCGTYSKFHDGSMPTTRKYTRRPSHFSPRSRSFPDCYRKEGICQQAATTHHSLHLTIEQKVCHPTTRLVVDRFALKHDAQLLGHLDRWTAKTTSIDEFGPEPVIYTRRDLTKDEGTQSFLVLAVGEQRSEDGSGPFTNVWCIQDAHEALVVLFNGIGWSGHVVEAEVAGQRLDILPV